MNAGSDSKHRVTRTPRAGHRTIVGAAPGAERKGAQTCCAWGMYATRAGWCMMNVKGRVSWKKCAACGFMSSISRSKITIAYAMVSRNGRGPEAVGLGLARKLRWMIEVCSVRDEREVQCADRDEAQKDVAAFVNDDLHDLEVILEGMTSVSAVRKLK